MRLVMKCRGAELEDVIELATAIELTTRPMPKWWQVMKCRDAELEDVIELATVIVERSFILTNLFESVKYSSIFFRIG